MIKKNDFWILSLGLHKNMESMSMQILCEQRCVENEKIVSGKLSQPRVLYDIEISVRLTVRGIIYMIVSLNFVPLFLRVSVP